MTDLRLTRDFDVTPEALFDVVTTRAGLLRWWGPEGLRETSDGLDLSRLGPWHSVMQNEAGERYKVSGQVTQVDRPRSVGFTWAWHDPDDRRGAESHVTFTVEPRGSGARLILDHRDLADAEQAGNHVSGWTSSLRKLTAAMAARPTRKGTGKCPNT